MSTTPANPSLAIDGAAAATASPVVRSRLAALILAAVGIVYGDIGTSPLYTLKTVFSPEHGLQLNHVNLLGVISLIFWEIGRASCRERVL